MIIHIYLLRAFPTTQCLPIMNSHLLPVESLSFDLFPRCTQKVVMNRKCLNPYQMTRNTQIKGWGKVKRSCSNSFKIYAANFYVHHSRVRKQVKLSGSLSFHLLQIRINTARRNSYIIPMFRHFLEKIK